MDVEERSRSASAARRCRLSTSAPIFCDVLTFYFLLCYRPFGIQFHVETSLFNVYFAKLDRGTVKPVRWGVGDEHLDQVKSFGVKTFEDFTWKHMLDFYSCADCGRCSDNARPMPWAGRCRRGSSPSRRRDYSFQHYPMFGTRRQRHAIDRRHLFRR